MNAVDAIVVGGGLFGQIIAKALTAQGRDVMILDAGMKGAGSTPAACLMKPSWFSSLGKEVYTPALQLLDDLYGVEDVEFQLRPLRWGGKIGQATVHWIPPSKILQSNLITCAHVTAIERGWVQYTSLPDNEHNTIFADLVVVAAGVWTYHLMPQYKQQAQKGIAFLWPDSAIRHPFIRPWAPYKQLVAFNRGDGLWVSDGTAIKADNWTGEREAKARSRCIESVDPGHEAGPPAPLLGNRPYAKGHKPCLLEQPAPGLWVASGGAKNGTLAAGWAAHVITSQSS